MAKVINVNRTKCHAESMRLRRMIINHDRVRHKRLSNEAMRRLVAAQAMLDLAVGETNPMLLGKNVDYK
jgi:hypothetical protein